MLQTNTPTAAVDDADNLFASGGAPLPGGGTLISRIYVIPASTASGTPDWIKYNDRPSGLSIAAFAIDGDDLYFVQKLNTTGGWHIVVTVSSINIPDTEELPINRQFVSATITDTSNVVRGVTINNDLVYVSGGTASTGNNPNPKVWAIDKNTVDGAVAPLVEEYTDTEVSGIYWGIAFG